MDVIDWQYGRDIHNHWVHNETSSVHQIQRRIQLLRSDVFCCFVITFTLFIDLCYFHLYVYNIPDYIGREGFRWWLRLSRCASIFEKADLNIQSLYWRFVSKWLLQLGWWFECWKKSKVLFNCEKHYCDDCLGFLDFGHLLDYDCHA